MKYLKTWWLLVLFLLTLPYTMLAIVGSVWLYQHHLLLVFLITSSVLIGVLWPVARWLRKQRGAAIEAADPHADGPPLARQAWAAVDAIARRVEHEDVRIERPEDVWPLAHEVLQGVAKQYHPTSKDAVLEVPLPHVLRIVELVAADLRQAVSRHVPGSHILTLADVGRIKRLSSLGRPLYALYRVLYFGFNPVGAVVREVRELGTNSLIDDSAGELKKWALGFSVRRAGYYAIELYSGRLVIDDVEFRAYQTEQAGRDQKHQQQRDDADIQEPLRILVVGQVKAGKSSLINAVFGETKAAVDVVPRTKYVEPYAIETGGIKRAIILDTAGYEDAARPGEAIDQLQNDILLCDLVLMVCSSASAARRPDRQLLDALRSLFERHPDRIMPPLIVALTHIDRLRPIAEWSPPYDLTKPEGAKASNILDAMQAVAADLSVDVGQVVPVCLKSGETYNVEEGLAPAMLQAMPQADRVRCLRCLERFHEEQYWQRVWQQAATSGRLLVKAGLSWAAAGTRKLDDLTSDLHGK